MGMTLSELTDLKNKLSYWSSTGKFLTPEMIAREQGRLSALDSLSKFWKTAGPSMNKLMDAIPTLKTEAASYLPKGASASAVRKAAARYIPAASPFDEVIKRYAGTAVQTAKRTSRSNPLTAVLFDLMFPSKLNDVNEEELIRKTKPQRPIM